MTKKKELCLFNVYMCLRKGLKCISFHSSKSQSPFVKCKNMFDIKVLCRQRFSERRKWNLFFASHSLSLICLPDNWQSLERTLIIRNYAQMLHYLNLETWNNPEWGNFLLKIIMNRPRLKQNLPQCSQSKYFHMTFAENKNLVKKGSTWF